MEAIKKKSKAHTIYKNSEGKRIPSVTTVLGLKAKPQLIKWANNLGLEGIDCTKYVDETAKIGTLTHYMVECYLTKKEADYSDYTDEQIALATVGFNKFLEWLKGKEYKTLANELSLSNELYGGTLDWYCILDNKYTLVDFKTGSGIYDEYYYQTCAYRNLMQEKDYQVDQIIILNIGRNPDDALKEAHIDKFDKYYGVFECLLKMYYLEKEIKKNE